MDLKQQMRVLGQTVAREARARQHMAVAATAFQLYLLTHAEMRSQISRKNAAIYRKLATAVRKIIPEKDLPMPAENALFPGTGRADIGIDFHILSDAWTHFRRGLRGRIRSPCLERLHLAVESLRRS